MNPAGAVMQAYDEGTIHPDRYMSYLQIIESLLLDEVFGEHCCTFGVNSVDCSNESPLTDLNLLIMIRSTRILLHCLFWHWLYSSNLHTPQFGDAGGKSSGPESMMPSFLLGEYMRPAAEDFQPVWKPDVSLRQAHTVCWVFPWTFRANDRPCHPI